MTARRGCRRQPNIDPRTALSTACSRTCLNTVGGASPLEVTPSEPSVGGTSSSVSGGSVLAKSQRVSKVCSEMPHVLKRIVNKQMYTMLYEMYNVYDGIHELYGLHVPGLPFCMQRIGSVFHTCPAEQSGPPEWSNISKIIKQPSNTNHRMLSLSLSLGVHTILYIIIQCFAGWLSSRSRQWAAGRCRYVNRLPVF